MLGLGTVLNLDQDTKYCPAFCRVGATPVLFGLITTVIQYYQKQIRRSFYVAPVLLDPGQYIVRPRLSPVVVVVVFVGQG